MCFTDRILESIKEGKKLAESMFRVIESETQNCIKTFALPVPKKADKDSAIGDAQLASLQSRPIDLDAGSYGVLEDKREESRPATAPEAEGGTAEGAISISSSQ